ncbi:MAG: glycoside hydrolase family 88 protein [Bacteroidales bacterium]|nr:glycoside hydrolase family 88 protein [Bacteroidales bacterium]
MLENFPAGADPVEIGNRVGNRLLETKHQLYGKKGIHYAEVCTWYGALRFAKATGNDELLNKLRARFDYLAENEKDLLPPPVHVDQNMFGCLPLRLYAITGQKSYLDMGLMYADTQWTLPENATAEEKAFQDKDYSWQTRLWIDDMFMITIVQKEAYLRTGDKKYLDRAAREMVMYLDELQRENGLFYHAPDVPYCWSRGDGWMAVGMADLLGLLPEGDENRAAIMKGYLKMMEGLRKNINKDGIWNQVIDEKDFWSESSGSAMFTYAMIRGVKNGWLDEATYAPIVRRAWLSICNYVLPNGDVDEVCVGTGKKNSRQYYYNRPRVAGDYHGQAPVIWCALALLSDAK